VGEVKVQISHSLCALPGTKLADLKEVLSHPQGLAQCSRFFGRNPQIKSTAFYDTAGSAEEVAKRGDKTVGAIASAYAGKFYGLDILAEGIENLPGVNFTRFYAIQKTANPLPEEGTIKTTLLFMLSDSGKSGALHAALGCFAKRNLNLTRIESRPHPDRPWEYIFHLSFEGSPKDEAAIEALEELQSYCDFVYRLGSFREGSTEKLTY
jgi:prephenate dehydratase